MPTIYDNTFVVPESRIGMKSADLISLTIFMQKMGGKFMRFIVLILSLGSVVLYGKALAGLGSFLLGRDQLGLIAIGLLGGTLSAIVALICWKLYLKELSSETEKIDED